MDLNFLLLRALAAGLLLIATFTHLPAEAAPVTTSCSLNADSPEAARQRIIELRAQIAHHDELYFKKAAPEITDAAYDALKRELRALEQAYPTETSGIAKPSTLADDHSAGFAKAGHRTPALSLEKAYTEAEVRAFCARIEKTLGHSAPFVIEPKIDGLSVTAVYEDGRLIRAVTRGDGRTGDDITANALNIRSLPRELRRTKPDGTPNPIPSFVELRGEIYLSRAEFDRINREREAEGEPPLAHPRNVATGTIKSLDPSETAERKLDIVFYGWGACEPASTEPTSQQQLHAQLRNWGLPTLETFDVAQSPDEVWRSVQSLGRKRETLAAPTDGVVIKLDDVSSRRQFGETAEAPRWAIAYKFPPERVVTQLRSITIQVGRTGVLTPVAELQPVKLAGSTIARATLHNRDQIARLDLREGDFVFLEKAGEIIPEIVGVDLKQRPATAQPFEFPSLCPVCGHPVENDPEAAAVRCPNFDCPARLLRRLAHFVGKSGVDIAGLGEVTLQGLVGNGTIRQPSDLYSLTPRHFLKKPGVNKKLATKILEEIERSRHAELWRFINGLGIPHVGPATAKLLAKHFGSLEKFAAAKPSDLPADLGATAISSVANYLGSQDNRIELLAIAKSIRPTSVTASPQTLAGKTFVLTGRLLSLTREEATRRIEAAGGSVQESVTKSTTFVVAGEAPGEKLTRAKALSIPVINEADLRQMLEARP